MEIFLSSLFRWLFRRRSLRSLLLFCLSGGLVLATAIAAPAQAAREIAWEDLQPAKATIEDPMAHLPPEQYADMSSLARIGWWIESGETSSDGPDAERAEELRRSLTEQGVAVDAVLAELDAARQQWLQQSRGINGDLEGQSVKLAGFVLPLDVSASMLEQSIKSENGHDEAKVQAAQRQRAQGPRSQDPRSQDLRSQDQSASEQASRFLLVPYVGACVHVPPPAANQMVYVEPSQELDTPGLFDRVWLEGQLRQQPGTYDLYLVDGVRQVRASYALDLKAITPYIPEGQGLFDVGGHFEGPWWQSLQARSSAMITGTLVAMRDRRSPAALALGIGIAFAYGVLHTLGPGHGKAIIISYFVGEGGSFRKGVSMGVRVAVFHVFSAILVAVLTDVVVRQTIGSAPGSYRVVRLISYGAIAAIGAWMLWNATAPSPALAASPSAPAGTLAADAAVNPLSPNLIRAVLEEDSQLNIQEQFAPHQFEGDCGCYSCIDPQRSGGWLALAIGAVPCSGALLVLIYGLANDLLWPAVLMVVAISVGMAIALSGIGVAAIWGRRFADRRISLGKSTRHQQRLFRGLRVAGAACVLLVGMFLFGMTLSLPTLPLLS